jgi:hypothetical protein
MTLGSKDLIVSRVNKQRNVVQKLRPITPWDRTIHAISIQYDKESECVEMSTISSWHFDTDDQQKDDFFMKSIFLVQ